MPSQQGVWEGKKRTQKHIKEGKIPFVRDGSSKHHIMIQYFAAGGIWVNEILYGEENTSVSFSIFMGFLPRSVPNSPIAVGYRLD